MEFQKRRRRSSNDIEESINNAAIQLIEEKGFQNLTVTAIMQKAKIEPVVFYNRYSDLNNYMDEFVKKYDYWFSDTAKNIESIDKLGESYVSILKTLFDSLISNRMMQQLLRWELSSDNETTRRTAKLREFHTLPLVEKYKKRFVNSPVDIDAVSAIIIGGLYYLTLHADLSEFAGIDIRSDQGKRKMNDAIESFVGIIFSDMSPNSEALKIAKKMKDMGVEINTISEYTELSLDIIRQL